MKNFSQVNKQRGASMWGLIGGAALIVVFALVIIKLVPAYIHNSKIQSALESLANTPGAATMSRREVILKIDNTLYVDMASGSLNLGQSLTISKTRTHKVFTISYEDVIPMAYNISALLDFENSVEVPLN